MTATEMANRDLLFPRAWTRTCAGGIVLISRQNSVLGCVYDLILPEVLGHLLRHRTHDCTAHQALNTLLALVNYWDQEPERALVLGPDPRTGLEQAIVHLKQRIVLESPNGG